MAAKKKRMSKEELRAPDRFEQNVEAAWKKVAPHKGKIMAVIGVLLVIGIGWTIYGSMSDGAKADKADALSAAMYPLTAPTWNPEEDAKPLQDGTIPVKPAGETFKTGEEAHKAAIERLRKYLSEHGSDPGANAVALGVAGLKIDTDPKAAAAELEAWIGKNAENKVLPMVRLVAARAQVAAGALDQARAHFDAVAGKSAGWLKAAALVGLGDLDHPLMAAKGSKGDAAKAKASYEAAQKELGVQNGEPSSGAGLKSDIETKLAALP